MFDLLGVPKSTDIAYGWIVKLFDSAESAPLGAAFGVFTSSLAILGAMFVCWHILVGIVHSAYSGKVLGERWHQIWAPLRVVLGFGLMVPVGGGFSPVHFLLKDVIGVAAVNLGNAPIMAYLAEATNRKTEGKLYTNAGSDIVNLVVEREICYGVVTGYNDILSRAASYVAVVYRPTDGEPNTPKFMSSINPPPSAWYYENCGSLTLNPVQKPSSEFLKASDADFDTFNRKRVEAMTALVKSVQSKDFMDYEKLGKYLATQGAFDDAAPITDDQVRSLQSTGVLPVDLVSKTLAIGETYNRAVSAAAAELFNKASKDNAETLKNRLVDYGFMAAGSYERSLSMISGLVVGVADARPQSVDATFAQAYAGRIAKALSAAASVRKQEAELGVSTGTSQPSDESEWSTFLLSKIFTPNLLNMKLQANSPDPIGDMITFGHTLLGAASLGIVGLAGMSAGSGFLRGIPGLGGAAGGVIEYLSQWIGYVIMIFVVVGIMHSFVLPMLPMMMVFIMGVSWLVLFLEAAIAGVLWAFAFIRMDGQEFFDKNQAPGVTLLFNLLLRPAISMLAYCGMLLLLPTLLNSLSLLWDQSYGVQTGQLTWLFVWQWLAGLILFTYMQWHLTLRITSVIPTIADRVGHWMGFSGMHGYNDGQETSQALGAMGAVALAAKAAPLLPGPKRGGGGGGGGGEPSQTDKLIKGMADKMGVKAESETSNTQATKTEANSSQKTGESPQK